MVKESVREIEIADVVIDRKLLVRIEPDPETVKQYAELVVLAIASAGCGLA